MPYSRHSPSPRYREMLEQYRLLHASGEQHRHLSADETYPGISLLAHVARIKALIDANQGRDILDYGAGKGIVYSLSPVSVPGVGAVDGVLDYWDVDSVHCYDPCHEPYSKLPQGQFDGVITTDVLEHCPEQDVPWIVDEIFGYARKFVFAAIASYPALTHLPNGENAHCTIRPVQWWQQTFESAAARHPGIRWAIVVQSLRESGKGRELVEEQCAGGRATP
jgi:hypothetical protein